MEHHVERAARNAKNLSCSTAVPIGSIERPPDRFVFYRFQRRSNADNKLIFAVPDLVNFLWKIVERYATLLSRDDGPLDRVPKLPHVARPIVRPERGQRFGVEAVNILSVLPIELLNEVGNKQIEVLKSFAQWRDRNPENVKAVVQILPQFPVCESFVKRAVSGGDHANFNRDAFFAANPSDLVVFENAKKFRLKLGLHLGYFVQEDGPAIGLLEDPEPPGGCARERTAFVPEQLTLD
jgi:hypothetical protein